MFILVGCSRGNKCLSVQKRTCPPDHLLDLNKNGNNKVSSLYGSSLRKKFHQGYENKIIELNTFLLHHCSIYAYTCISIFIYIYIYIDPKAGEACAERFFFLSTHSDRRT